MSAYRDQVLADGAVAYWRLDETSGTTAASEVGNYPGTISGGVTLAQPGALADGNTAMAFDGSTGYVDIGNIAAFAFTGAFSVECWLKSLSATARFLVNKVNSASGQGWAVQLNPAVVFYSYSTGGALFHFNTPAPFFNDGAWHHSVATWDGTTSANGAKIYMDGSLRVSATAAAGTPAVNSRRCLIGATDLFPGQGGYFSGSIDDVALYATALTPQQIATHYELRTATLAPPNDLRYRWCRFVRHPYRHPPLTTRRRRV